MSLSRYSFPPPDRRGYSFLLSLLHHRSTTSPRQSLSLSRVSLSISCLVSLLSVPSSGPPLPPPLSCTNDPGRGFLSAVPRACQPFSSQFPTSVRRSPLQLKK
ncbi:hypothetical protein IHE45_10G055700 [Dioscorea alata]|uniref:Uncharacterized protein n=1 Tax=Dioscorea alata TaxID=55571 RepID=A0ACB7VB67_DIOAL|nr:hypothetical protein IHE45_10G055700 [Dioscorea alata]